MVSLKQSLDARKSWKLNKGIWKCQRKAEGPEIGAKKCTREREVEKPTKGVAR